jgi:Reverse transcriptase (RNA-dependent DNA polymerase)
LVFEALQNVYGGKDAGRQCYLYLKQRLEAIGFKVSDHDKCMFYRGNVIYCLYTDNSLLAAPTDNELEEVIRDMKSTGLDLTVEGLLEDFLGVHIETQEDGTYELSQARLIKTVIKEILGDSPPSTCKDIPMASSRLLSRHLDSEDHDESRFSMCRIVGKLNFLASSMRPDIAYATHQIACFVSNPKVEHTKAVEWLARYLMSTRDRGYIIEPDPTKSVEIYVDADFAGN